MLTKFLRDAFFIASILKLLDIGVLTYEGYDLLSLLQHLFFGLLYLTIYYALDYGIREYYKEKGE